MTDGNLEFLQVVLSMGVCTGGVALVLKRDERRERRRPRWKPGAWLPSTLDAAILGTFLFSWLYGAPALVIHFVKSRWTVLGLLVGLGWAIALVGTDLAAQIAMAEAIDWLGL